MIWASLTYDQICDLRKYGAKKKKKMELFTTIKKTISCRSDNIHYEFWILEQKWQHFTRVRAAHLRSGSRDGYSRQSCGRRRLRLRAADKSRLVVGQEASGWSRQNRRCQEKDIMTLMQMASLWCGGGGPARLCYDCRVRVVKRFPHEHPCLFKQRELMH